MRCRVVLPVVNAIWIGSKLGSIHAACLTSFVVAGHRTVLHCYQRPEDTPAGIELADARKLMPESAVISYRKSGSFSLFSNIYRLKILEAGLGLYVDCDVFCLKPIQDKDFIFGFETDTGLNGAVLKLPSDSRVLKDFLAAAVDRSFIPPWYKKSRRRQLGFRKAIGFPVTVDRLPWGTLGPRALTYFAEESGVLSHGAPIDVFYPVPFDRVGLFVDPALSLEDLITHRTSCVHLYHQKLKAFAADISATCPLGELMRRVQAPSEREGFDKMEIEPGRASRNGREVAGAATRMQTTT